METRAPNRHHVVVAVRAAALEVTTTTILPIFVPRHLTPEAGPAGSSVLVAGDGCSEFRGGELVTLTFAGESPTIAVDSEGAWNRMLTIPADAEIGDAFAISALCVKESTTTSTFVVDPTATTATALPRTGSNDPSGLAAPALSLVGAGGLLILSRRRR